MSAIGNAGTIIAETVKWIVYLSIPAIFIFFAYTRFHWARNYIDRFIGKKGINHSAQPRATNPQNVEGEKQGPRGEEVKAHLQDNGVHIVIPYGDSSITIDLKPTDQKRREEEKKIIPTA